MTAALGCALLAAALAAALTRAVPQRLGTNRVLATVATVVPFGASAICQDAEHVPAGTGAVRLSLSPVGGAAGPALAVSVAPPGGGPAARGALAAGWRGHAATVPIRPVTRTAATARVCTRADGGVTLTTAATHGAPAAVDGRPIGGRLRTDWFAPEPRSWASQARAIARRMGFGHALAGGAIPLLSALLALGAIAAALWQVTRSEP